MSLTYGFYNSLNGDRKYDAVQLSRLFDGLIIDGIFASIGTCFVVKADAGLNINVGIGKAWFQHTWTFNDAILPITAPISEVLLDRIDAVILEVDTSEAVRANSIKIIQGTPSSTPARPPMISGATMRQYPLCYIYRAAGSSAITQANITNMVGSSDTPFITGILQTISITELISQWQNEFINWFDTIKGILIGDIAGELGVRVLALEKGSTLYQLKIDNTLVTENKTVAGAINEVRHSIPNRNLLDNTDFAHPVNQRNVSGTITAAGYFIDRWKLVSGSVALTANGLQLNGTMVQILEFAAGTSTAASVGMYSGTANASYNNNNKTFTLTSNGGVIGWAKLEKGNAATPYVLKGYAAELSECQRYLQSLEIFTIEYSAGADLTFTYSFTYGIPLKSRGIAPTVTFLQDAAFTNCTMPSYTSTLKSFAFSLKTTRNAMFGVSDLKPIISMEP